MAEIIIFGYKLKINLIDLFLLIVLSFICLSAGTQWGYAYRFQACEVVAFLSIVRIIYEKKAMLSGWKIYFTVFLAFLFYEYINSYSPKATYRFFIIFLSIMLFFWNEMSREFWEKLIRIIEVVCAIVAVSVIVSSFSPERFASVFSFILGSDMEASLRRAAHGQYAGLAREIAEAACLMNYGLAIVWARGIQDKFQKKDVILIVLYMIALMMTTKRTLFVIAVVIPVLIVFLMTKDNKLRIRLLLGFIVLALVMWVVAFSVPVLHTLIERFSELESDDNMSGRDILWFFSMKMFSERPVVGYGYGTYNAYVNNSGFNYLGGEWSAYGHNIYLECLAENGIIGTVLIFIPIAWSVIKGFGYMIKDTLDKNDKMLLQFFLYIDVMFIMYGYTGNCLLYIQQIYMWALVMIGIFYITRTRDKCE